MVWGVEMKDLCLSLLSVMIDDLREENKLQIQKWGVQDHEASEWMMFLTEEIGELAQAISEWQYRNGHERNVFNEAIQSATLALKIAEMFKKEESERLIDDYLSSEIED